MNLAERMSIVCKAIPKGKVAAYGQIAELCGYFRHARQVGHILMTDRAGDIPAHRIVNSKGELSGAHHFHFPDMQKNLLEAEGVTVTFNGKLWQVDLKKYIWRPDESEWEAFRRLFSENPKQEEI